MITNSGNLGEYEEEFKEMEAKLKKANDIIGKGLSSHTKVLQSSDKIDMLERKLGEMGRRVQHLNELITDTETQNREVNSDIDELRNQLGIAEREIDSIEYQASQVNSSSLKGIIDGIRAAGERSEQAEESVNASSAVVDQAIKVKDHAAALIGDKFKEKQNKIPLDLTDADMELKKFDDIIRKANEEVCGRAGDSCEACGGVGCNNRCGGPTCPGAVNDTTHALMNANEARLLAEKKKNESDSIASELQVAQKAIIDAEKAAQEATTKAESAEAIASEVYENVTNLNWQLHQFREGDADRADPDEIREMAEYVLGKKPLSVATMHDLVNNSRTLLRNIEPSLVEVDDLYKQLYANATIVRKTALTFSDVTKRAEIASKDVEQLLQEAAKYQTAARDNLTEAEPYVDAAGEITSDARRKVEEADSLLETVSAKISKMEKDADDVEKKADDNNGLYNKAKQKVNDVKSALEHTQDVSKLPMFFIAFVNYKLCFRTLTY
jgi:coxsackievirus/adenovirus receptor